MKPTTDDDALVDVIDVLLRDGAVVRADVIVSVAEIPLVGIKLTAAIAGMETMTDYGLFEEWDTSRRKAAVARRQYSHRDRQRASGDVNTNTNANANTSPNSSETGDSTESKSESGSVGVDVVDGETTDSN